MGTKTAPIASTRKPANRLTGKKNKLLPVQYFMTTFTLPCEFRTVAYKYSSQNDRITFRYVKNETEEIRHRTLKGEDFLRLLQHHFLARGLRLSSQQCQKISLSGSAYSSYPDRGYGGPSKACLEMPSLRITDDCCRCKTGPIRIEKSPGKNPASTFIGDERHHDIICFFYEPQKGLRYTCALP